MAKDILIVTDLSGFVGTNLQQYLGEEFELRAVPRISPSNQIEFDSFFKNNDANSAIIHLAGKAHDLKQVSKPEDYYKVNTDLTKAIFDKFLTSSAKTFIFLSSVKAVADEAEEILTEATNPHPITYYGKSKLLAEQYILQNLSTVGKRIYILRPCMIYGPKNKGNLNLIYQWVRKGYYWPLGKFENKRSFCSVDNLNFVIRELIIREDVESGVYNIADDEQMSTNELIQLISDSMNKKAKISMIPQEIIIGIAKLGNIVKSPLNTERLNKLTQNYIVSNRKITKAISKSLPVKSRDGLLKTFQSLYNYGQ